MSGEKILVAEDEPDVLDIMSKKIAQEGYVVIKAIDGQEALDKIYSDNPDVVILDIIMPKLDGFEVLKKLRENPNPIRWQPVIIVSAKSDLENIKKGYDLEADYYITKPFNMSAVLKGIRMMLNLAPLRKTRQDLDN